MGTQPFIRSVKSLVSGIRAEPSGNWDARSVMSGLFLTQSRDEQTHVVNRANEGFTLVPGQTVLN
jgi:hypothetical protein